MDRGQRFGDDRETSHRIFWVVRIGLTIICQWTVDSRKNHRSWSTSVEGFRDHVNHWRLSVWNLRKVECVWVESCATRPWWEEMGPMHGMHFMHGTLDADLEVQDTLLLNGIGGSTTVPVDKKGLIDGLLDGRNEAHWPESKGRRSLDVNLGGDARNSQKKGCCWMSSMSRWIAQRRWSRVNSVQPKRDEIDVAVQYTGIFRCFVEEWHDWEGLEVKSKEKWTQKGAAKKHQGSGLRSRAMIADLDEEDTAKKDEDTRDVLRSRGRKKRLGKDFNNKLTRYKKSTRVRSCVDYNSEWNNLFV